MADRCTTLQLTLPCRLSEVTEWLTEVIRVLGDRVVVVGSPADDRAVQLSVIEFADGHHRITIHHKEEL